MQSEGPTRVAVIGSGPSGFFATAALLEGPAVEVDLFERLPTPFGLIRGGVAPDHPKIKNVANVFSKTGADPRFRYFGGVQVGRDVTLEDLLARYDQVLVATGAPKPRGLGIPGADLAGSRSAGDFVAWYNGHPDAADFDFDLSAVHTVVVVGIGNVAMDVARVLLKSPDELARTDMPEAPLARLRGSAVRRVVLLGRRGLAQAAFATTSLKELGDLPGVSLVCDDLELDPASARWLEAQSPTERRAHERNRDYLAAQVADPADRRVELVLCASPVALLGDEHVAGVVVERNELVYSDGWVRPVGSGRTTTLDAQLVLAAVGYRGVPLPGLPFDARSATVPNDAGRVLGPDGPIPGLFVTGWAGHGPIGLVGDAKRSAHTSVEAMRHSEPTGHAPADTIEPWLRTAVPTLVTWSDWLARDAREVAAGAPLGKPRRKDTETEGSGR